MVFFQKNKQKNTDQILIEDAKRKIAKGKWYHKYEILPGVFTTGSCSIDPKSLLDQLGISQNLSEAKALDIGTWDGPIAFELEKRGAEVVAFDIQDPSRTGFNIAKDILKSNVKYIQASVYDLSKVVNTKFDIICFFGVFYHLKHPIIAFEEIEKNLTDNGILLFEGECLHHHVETLDGSPIDPEILKILPLLNSSNIPLTLFYAGKYKNDPSNWYVPNIACFKSWLNSAGLECKKHWLITDSQKHHPTQRISGIATKASHLRTAEHGLM